MFRGPRLNKLKRFLCGIVGVFGITIGLLHPQHSYSYSYRNWFGGLAFGPVAAILGVVCLLAAIFNWRKIWDRQPTRK